MAALIVGVIAAIAVTVGVVVAVFLADTDGDEAAEIQPIDSASDEGASTGSNDPVSSTEDAEASGAADEIDDVRSCSWVGDEVAIELVNNSSKTSNYIITTAYLDEAGNRVADETHFVNGVRPGEQVQERNTAFEDAAPGCEVIDVERFAGESDAGALTGHEPVSLTAGRSRSRPVRGRPPRPGCRRLRS
jgi:hypothetical protein